MSKGQAVPIDINGYFWWRVVMPRRMRVEFAGAVYHVLDRGDRREAIFRDDVDRELFLQTLQEACSRTGWRLHAYVIMSSRAERVRLAVGEPEGRRGRAPSITIISCWRPPSQTWWRTCNGFSRHIPFASTAVTGSAVTFSRGVTKPCWWTRRSAAIL